MVSPRESMEAVVRAIESSDNLPDEMSYLLHEADQEGSDSDIHLPLVEVQPVTSARVSPNNSDLVGWVEDSNGNKTGQIYHSQYVLDIQVDVWTAQGGNYSPDDLGAKVRDALYQYASHGPAQNFLDENGQALDSVFRFELGDGERADDLIQSPTLRRWRQDFTIWGYEEFRTDEDYIVAVDYPESGEMTSDDGGTIRN